MRPDWLKAAFDTQYGEDVRVVAPAEAGSIRELRAARLTILINALRRENLDLPAVTMLLGCSASTARTYICELLDARLIRASRPTHLRGRVPHATYAFDAKPQYLDEYLRRYRCGADQVRASTASGHRDPLVQALFGNNVTEAC